MIDTLALTLLAAALPPGPALSPQDDATEADLPAPDALVLPAGDLLEHDIVATSGRGTEGPEDVTIGTLHEVLVHSKTGEILGVVVLDADGPLRRIEWGDLLIERNELEGGLDVRYTESDAAFDLLPEMKPELLRTRPLSPEGAGMNPEEMPDGEERKDDRNDGDRIVDPKPRDYEVRVTEFDGLEVFGPGELRAYGTTSDVVLDCGAGAMTYLTAKVRGDAYLLPCDTLMVRSVYTEPNPENDVLAVVTNMNATTVLGASAIDPDDEDKDPRNAEFRAEVDKYFEAARRR